MSETSDKTESKPIEVDVDDLIVAFHSQNYDAFWFLDLQTGGVVLYYDGMLNGESVEEDFDIDVDLDSDRYRVIRGIESSKSYGFMEDFIDQLPGGHANQALADAISRSKPFRRFKDALFNLGAVREQWFAFEEECHKQAARDWLEEEEVNAVFVKKMGGAI